MALDGPIVVTGAAGFIGRSVMAELASRDLPSAVLARPFGDTEALLNRLRELCPRAIVHLAGMRESDDADALREANVQLASRLLDAAGMLEDNPVVVLAGSAAEYGPVPDDELPLTEGRPCKPATPYGQTKLAQTLLGQAAFERGLPTVCARLFNVIGPGMPDHLPLGRFATEIAGLGPEGGVVETGALDIERDYFPVADAASALVGLAINPRAPGLIVNVCTGRATPLRALAEGLASACGKPVRFRVNGSPSPGNARNYGSPGRLEALGLRMPTRSVAELIASLRHRDV